ncbi:MAG: hypothetical protein QOH97_2720 [Actinoplanes sp.]|jgi:hypothetical protein|nr:hypothetical protein [Actinoplanes sp.]
MAMTPERLAAWNALQARWKAEQERKRAEQADSTKKGRR